MEMYIPPPDKQEAPPPPYHVAIAKHWLSCMHTYTCLYLSFSCFKKIMN
jgi:hypothetical protein